MTNKIAFDDKAHSILTGLLDATEDWLVRRNKYPSKTANDFICRDYIETCSGIIWGSTYFVDSDERIGTEIFLERLNGARVKLRSARTMRRCAEQLLTYPQTYFPNYPTILRIIYLAELSKLDDLALMQMSGILKLAAANLPGVRSDVRRELRRRGQDRSSVIVHDDTIERKLSRYSASLLPMTLDTDQV